MRDNTSKLAHSITWKGSKQTYFTGRFMVDKDLVSDFFRAYAYFRWADDMVDNEASKDSPSLSADESTAFINRQKELIDGLYKNESLDSLVPEEEILADLISHDRGEKNSGLQSYIRNMFAIIEFDTYRKARLISESELTWYTNTLAKSVTDGLHYFVSNGRPYSARDKRYSAALAAHITHLLRDMVQDTENGFINIPREYLEVHNISPNDIHSAPYQAWVRNRVELAYKYFDEGKRYLDDLSILRIKIVGFWYCARFENVVKTIEHDGYTLRREYNERGKISTWLRIIWLGVSVTIKHVFGRVFAKRS